MGFAAFKQIKVFVLIFGLILSTYLHENQILFKFSKFFHNFHLSESSFTCPGLRASELVLSTKQTYNMNESFQLRIDQ